MRRRGELAAADRRRISTATGRRIYRFGTPAETVPPALLFVALLRPALTMEIDDRRRLQELDRPALREYQRQRLNALLERILPHNAFYTARLRGCSLPLRTLDQLADLPLTAKDDLCGAGGESLAAHLTYPIDHYSRFHRTSGTRGKPLIVLDTAEDWAWWVATWQYVLDAAGVVPADRVLLAFSFGPFIGFWSAFDAAAARGSLVIPSGGLTSRARLELLRSMDATVVCCTPSYALHLAEVARECGTDLRGSAVRVLIVAGEPGGSLPAVRRRIEEAWNAAVVDHAGATEIGPWGLADPQRRGLLVNEAEFIPEFLPRPERGPKGEPLAELVLTALGRAGAPVIRYRTGDLVRVPPAAPPRGWTLLEGGVVGRCDDMLIIRGVNVFPTAIEQIVRELCEPVEYRVLVTRRGALDHVELEIEAESGAAAALGRAAARSARAALRSPAGSARQFAAVRGEGAARRGPPRSCRSRPERGCRAAAESGRWAMNFFAEHHAEIRQNFPGLARRVGDRPAAFLDGPAGTQVPRQVLDAVGHTLAHVNANHGGCFATSVETDRLMAAARSAAADFFQASDPDEIVFGPNMTTLTLGLSRRPGPHLASGR